MSEFEPLARGFLGGFRVAAPADEVFPLFSPEGERGWVPGWEWEPLDPRSGGWAEEMLFRTREEHGEAVWIVTLLADDERRVVYHRVEPGRWVARVEVRCEISPSGGTEVRTSYRYVSLSERGNREIAAMRDEEYEAKMLRWSGWIAARRERSG